MATLREQIENKKKFIEKKQALIQKKQGWIEKKEEQRNALPEGNEKVWLGYDIESLKGDIRRAERDIAEAEKRLQELDTKNKIEEEKKANRNIKIILDFLEAYKQEVVNYYGKGIKEYFIAYNTYWNSRNFLEENYNVFSEEFKQRREKLKEEFNAVRGYNEEYENPNYNPDNRWSRKYLTRHITGTAEYASNWYESVRTEQEAFDKLDKYLTKDCENKYDRLVDEVMYYTGKILDTTGLEIGAKGELNGIIIGEKGKANVHTEGAAGYNIQRFHYRTYVTPVK